jgi:hypothetical protein
MSATDLFHGDIEAEARAEFVAMMFNDNSSNFAGLYRLTGRLGERSGGFVLQTVGHSDALGASHGKWSIVAGSGSGELSGVSGDGDFTYERGAASSLRLNYEF